MGRIGQLTDVVLGSIATVSQATDVTPGQLLSHEIEDSTGELTSGPIGHIELFGVLRFEREVEANRDAEGVVGPPGEGKAHEGQHEVHAPQRTVFLPG